MTKPDAHSISVVAARAHDVMSVQELGMPSVLLMEKLQEEEDRERRLQFLTLLGAHGDEAREKAGLPSARGRLAFGGVDTDGDGIDDGTEVGFVDVPGHERFVKNMLAGAAGVDRTLWIRNSPSCHSTRRPPPRRAACW